LFFVFFDIPHRYKIYIEGFGWSVSEKYILACDSVTLLVKPKFYDFFTRGLQPLHHYWPIRTDGKCKSIKFAVDWGNNHEQKVSLSNTNFYLENYICLAFSFSLLYFLANISIKLDGIYAYVGTIYGKSSK
jgi:hypothetical protein